MPPGEELPPWQADAANRKAAYLAIQAMIQETIAALNTARRVLRKNRDRMTPGQIESVAGTAARLEVNKATLTRAGASIIEAHPRDAWISGAAPEVLPLGAVQIPAMVIYLLAGAAVVTSIAFLISTLDAQQAYVDAQADALEQFNDCLESADTPAGIAGCSRILDVFETTAAAISESQSRTATGAIVRWGAILGLGILAFATMRGTK